MNKKLEKLVFSPSEENYEKLRKLFSVGPTHGWYYQTHMEKAELDYLLANPFARVLKMWRKHGRSGISIMTAAGLARIPLTEAREELRKLTVPSFCGGTGLPVYSYRWPAYRDWVDAYADDRENRMLRAFSKGWRTWANRFFHIPTRSGKVGADIWHDLRRAFLLQPRLARSRDPVAPRSHLLSQRWREVPDGMNFHY